MQLTLFDTGGPNPLAGLSESAKSVLIVMDRYPWAFDDLAHDVMATTKDTKQELSTSRNVKAAVLELVGARFVEIDGDVIRRIRDADD